MRLIPLLFLHLAWDTLVLFIVLRIAVRAGSLKWHRLGLACFAMAAWKLVLYLTLGVAAIVPVFLTMAPVLHWKYSLSLRVTAYVLALYLFLGIVFGAVLKLALGVLDLFFL